MMANDPNPTADLHLEAISAVTFLVAEMERSVRFYQSLSFRLLYGGPEATFSSFAAGSGYLNLTTGEGAPDTRWGRVIFHVADVDAFYRRALDLGYRPEAPPRDAPWGERYFHLRDPDGHELSFARPLATS